MKKTKEQLLEEQVKTLLLENNKLKKENVKLKVVYKNHQRNIKKMQFKLREGERKKRILEQKELALKTELKKKTRRLEEWQSQQ